MPKRYTKPKPKKKASVTYIGGEPFVTPPDVHAPVTPSETQRTHIEIPELSSRTRGVVQAIRERCLVNLNQPGSRNPLSELPLEKLRVVIGWLNSGRETPMALAKKILDVWAFERPVSMAKMVVTLENFAEMLHKFFPDALERNISEIAALIESSEPKGSPLDALRWKTALIKDLADNLAYWDAWSRKMDKPSPIVIKLAEVLGKQITDHGELQITIDENKRKARMEELNFKMRQLELQVKVRENEIREQRERESGSIPIEGQPVTGNRFAENLYKRLSDDSEGGDLAGAIPSIRSGLKKLAETPALKRKSVNGVVTNTERPDVSSSQEAID